MPEVGRRENVTLYPEFNMVEFLIDAKFRNGRQFYPYGDCIYFMTMATGNIY